MEKRNYRMLLVPLLFLALAVALMVNCGGGGGGGALQYLIRAWGQLPST